MDKIIPLKKEFVGKGEVKKFRFRQISNTKWGFLYEVNTRHMIYYEVFKKRLNSRFACVSYPTSKGFGIWAWTTPNIKRAFEILETFQELILTEAI